jgi:dCMP deaminase
MGWRKIVNRDEQNMLIAKAVAAGSKCASKSGKKGVIIVKQKKVIATGYSGPPAGIEPCWVRLKTFNIPIMDLHRHSSTFKGGPLRYRAVDCGEGECPRVSAGFSGSEGLEYCIASHAEVNAIVTAAFTGVSVEGATLYLYSPILPCKTCAGYIINSGIKEVIGLSLMEYEPVIRSLDMFKDAGVEYRALKSVAYDYDCGGF